MAYKNSPVLNTKIMFFQAIKWRRLCIFVFEPCVSATHKSALLCLYLNT